MTYRTPREMIEAGALVVCSHSGGKDSQAMLAYLRRTVPAEQLAIVHANLGHVEWPGTVDHIRATAGEDFAIVEAGRGLLDMVRRRHETRPDVAPWPSARYRQCTSDLKRGPIYKWIRHEMKRRGVTLAINAMGLRAEESSARAKRQPWKPNAELSKAGRTVYDWLPIHDWTEPQVFAYIADAGQTPHWAYKAGNRRLSCMFCIMGCDSDLKNAAQHAPELAREYIELERATGFTMFQGASLADRIGWNDTAEPAELAEQMELEL